MLENRFSLLFYLKRPKKYISGPIPVYLSITVDGKPTEISTGMTCEPTRWNTHANRANGTKKETKALNAHLDILQIKVHEARSKALESNTIITATLLKSILKGTEDKPRMLLEIFNNHNKKCIH